MVNNGKQIIEYTATKSKTILQILKEDLSFSNRLISKIKNDVLLNDKSAKTYDTTEIGDVLKVDIGFEETSDNIVPNNNIEIKVLYEDEWMLIVDKPPFMPVHPSINHYEDSLSNGVKAYFVENGINKKIRPVNRLDKDTTGIVIFAKSEYIQENLTDYEKYYLTIVDGQTDESGIIDKPIARKLPSIIERTIRDDGDQAITHYKTLEFKNNMSLVECKLETGRTHQIRVHMASIGHFIIGDDLYGESSTLINRQALHAYKIRFTHPVSRKEMVIESELPDDMKSILEQN
jgi:23S rRNA pseudouridine1911/1915/1917 synthase